MNLSTEEWKRRLRIMNRPPEPDEPELEELVGTNTWSSGSGFPLILPPKASAAPSSFVLTVVGLIAGLLMIHAIIYAHLDFAIAVTEAIVSLAVTTVWCCLYLARR